LTIAENIDLSIEAYKKDILNLSTRAECFVLIYYFNIN